MSPVLMTVLYCTSYLINDFGYSISLYAGIICGISILYALFSLSSKRKLCVSNQIIPITLLYAIVLVTSLHNYDIGDTTKNYYLIIILASFFSFFNITYDKHVKRIISNIIFGTGLFFSILIYFYKLFPQIYQTLIFPYLIDESIDEILFVTRQGYSLCVYGDVAYTLNIILFAMYIALFDNCSKPRYLSAAFLLGSIIISQRRTELLFGCFAILVTYFLCFYRYLILFIKKHILLFITLLFGVIAVTAFLILFWINMPENFLSSNRILMTIYEIKNHSDISNGRSGLYTVAWNLLKQNWLIGIGWMNFSHYSILSGLVRVRNVHNIFLQTMVECGLLGIFDTIRDHVKCDMIPRSFSLNSSSVSLSHPMVKRCIELGLSLYGSPTTSNQAVIPCPSLKIGPGDSARSHTANEYICLEEIREGIELFKSIIQYFEL